MHPQPQPDRHFAWVCWPNFKLKEAIFLHQNENIVKTLNLNLKLKNVIKVFFRFVTLKSTCQYIFVVALKMTAAAKQLQQRT